MQQYDFRMEHRHGLKYQNTDALSCLGSNSKHYARQEAKEQLEREELDQGEYFSCQSAGTSTTSTSEEVDPLRGGTIRS